MSESKFTDDEIQREIRRQARRGRNIDEETARAKKDLIYAARTDTPEVFQARLASVGIVPGSEQFRKAMEAYWAIQRGQR